MLHALVVRTVRLAVLVLLGLVPAAHAQPGPPPLFTYSPQSLAAGEAITLDGSRFDGATLAAVLVIDVRGQLVTFAVAPVAAGSFTVQVAIPTPGTHFVVVRDSLDRVAVNLVGAVTALPPGRGWFTFEPTAAAPGDDIAVEASGFGAGSTAAVLGVLDAQGQPTVLGFAPLVGGSLSASFGLPAGLPEGAYQVFLRDLAGPFGINATGPLAVAFPTGAPTIGVGRYPIGAAASWTTDRVYVPNGADDTLSVIDGAAGVRLLDVPVGSLPCAIAINQWAGRVYVANVNTNDVSVVDTATDTVVATVPVGSAPCAAGALPSLNRVFIGNYSADTVSVIDGTTNTVFATVPVGRGPFGIGVNVVTNRVYVANGYDATVSVIDGATSAVLATVPVGKDPDAIGVNPLNGRVYVGNYLSGTVSVIDGATSAVVATVVVGREPSAVAVNPTTGRVFVTNYASNTVSVIDGATNAVVATLPVGDTPDGLAVNPVTGRVYVVNSNTDDVTVLTDAF